MKMETQMSFKFLFDRSVKLLLTLLRQYIIDKIDGLHGKLVTGRGHIYWDLKLKLKPSGNLSNLI